MAFCKRAWLAAACLASVSPLWAAGGVVILDFGGNANDAPQRLIIGAADRIYTEVLTGSSLSDCGMYALDADGVLVSTFGTTGRLGLDVCTLGLRAQSDGSLLTLEPRTSGSLELLRLRLRDATGVTLSTSSDLPSSFTNARGAFAIDRQPDGKLLLGGGIRLCALCNEWLLGRFDADGSPDTTFSGGVIIKDLGTDYDKVKDVHVLSSGKILVSGTISPPPGLTTVMRFNADGTVDASFGANGKVLLPAGPGLTALDSAGRIYVPGLDGTVVRMDANGTVDGGYTAGTPDNGVKISGIAVDSANRVLLFGSKSGGYVARFDTAGAYDANFNGTGIATVTFTNGLAAVGSSQSCFGGLQSGDRPVLSCGVQAPVAGETDLAVVRFTAAGVLDTIFGAAQPDSDPYPDPFSFSNVMAAYGSAAVQSAAVTITGINTQARVTISGNAVGTSFSIGCNSTFTNATAFINAGQTVCVQQAASNQPGGTTQSTLTVGGQVATFTVVASNAPADSVPDAFAFVDQSNVELSAVTVSNTVTIQGITGFATVTVENGAYSVGCNPQGFVTTEGMVTNGDTVCVRHTSATAPETTTSTKLTVGGVFDTFTTTTLPSDTAPDVFTFTDQTGVTKGETVVSNVVTVTGINTSADITVSGGEFSISCNGSFTSAAGTIQSGQTVCVRHVAATRANTGVSTTLTIGGVSDVFTSRTVASGRGGGGSMDWFVLAILAVLALFSCKTARGRRAVDGGRFRAA